jgi:hypothetical protein
MELYHRQLFDQMQLSMVSHWFPLANHKMNHLQNHNHTRLFVVLQVLELLNQEKHKYHLELS